MPAIYTSRLPALAVKIRTGLPLIVQKTGSDAEAIARQLSRVDTGAMQGGWSFKMTGPTRGILGNSQEHAIYNEFGTRRMSAQPMVRPAIQQVSSSFFAAISKLLQ